MKAEGRTHPNNYLNDLDSKGWVKRKRSWSIIEDAVGDGDWTLVPRKLVEHLLTGYPVFDSWFVVDAVGESEWKTLKKKHPGTFPRKLVEHLLSCYTQKGHTVLDPFVGSGTTVVQAALMLRRSIGMDLNPEFIEIARQVLALKSPRANGTVGLGGWTEIPDEALITDAWNPTLTTADAWDGVRALEPESVHYTLTSPPYADFLHRSSGGVNTRHKQRKADGLKTTYSDHEWDIGNWSVGSWQSYLVEVAFELFRVTKPGHYMTIVVQNEMRIGLNPIAWKLALAIEAATDWALRPEQIWCQSEKPLTIHGWPKTFIINNHHHYCLNFFKPVDTRGP